MLTATVALLTFAGALFAYRLVTGPSVADRVVAIDALVLLAIAGVALAASQADHSHLLDIVVVLSLVAFVGTGVAARFIERRGA